MRKLKIDTYSLEHGCIEDSVSVPFFAAKAVAKLMPKKLAEKFDENGDQLQQLIDAISTAKHEGVLMEFQDPENSQRIVFSVS